MQKCIWQKLQPRKISYPIISVIEPEVHPPKTLTSDAHIRPIVSGCSAFRCFAGVELGHTCAKRPSGLSISCFCKQAPFRHEPAITCQYRVMRTKMAHWELLPPEIRLIILEMLARDPGSSKIGTGKTRPACYATVSKEWLAFFEKRNFYRLTLSPSCLVDFDRIVRRQRGLVKHVWLRIKLRTYRCSPCIESCTEPETNTRTASNNVIHQESYMETIYYS